jgi:Mg-chelatase subunit ChlD
VVTFASHYTSCGVTSQSATLDQPLTTNLPEITAAMATLSSTIWNGNTEISVGMNLGRTELNGANSRPTAQKLMIVLTDGAFTNGIHPQGEASLALSDGIRVHTITFGSCPPAVISDMQQTAAAGGGNHYHAPDGATLNDVFSDIAGSIAVLTQ